MNLILFWKFVYSETQKDFFVIFSILNSFCFDSFIFVFMVFSPFSWLKLKIFNCFFLFCIDFSGFSIKNVNFYFFLEYFREKKLFLGKIGIFL